MYFKMKICPSICFVFFSNAEFKKYTNKFKEICLDIRS